ncbi:conserved hypothetical protein [Ricinus communis]|uniref:Uncharacterized protein n=1 Tax=Ricinus communis TaxID=3988 RepID=B9TA82_RICCO|nr:conserved hypothetical protein [Ricinus communis]
MTTKRDPILLSSDEPGRCTTRQTQALPHPRDEQQAALGITVPLIVCDHAEARGARVYNSSAGNTSSLPIDVICHVRNVVSSSCGERALELATVHF